MTRITPDATVLVLGDAFHRLDNRLVRADTDGTDDLVRERILRDWIETATGVALNPATSHRGRKVKASVLLAIDRRMSPEPGLFHDVAVSIATDPRRVS